MARNSTTQPNNDTESIEFDWDNLGDGETRSKKSASVTIDVPAKLVQLAQNALTDQLVHTQKFPTEKIALHFATLMKAAGKHTTPECGMYVKHDKFTVSYSAGAKRGRKAGDDSASDSDSSE